MLGGGDHAAEAGHVGPADDDLQPVEWIESVARFAGKLGLNEVRVRWKLLRWHQAMGRSARRAEQRATHAGYEHRICGKCRAINHRSAARCGQCDSRLGPRWLQVLSRLGIGLPDHVAATVCLGLAVVLVYARMVVASMGGDQSGLSVMLFFDIDTLLAFGGNWPPLTLSGEYWRLATAVVLHAGIWHLGFNLIALSQVGPAIEDLYGRGVMVFLFMLTGVVASLGSSFIGRPGVSIGASGALMGLIGLAAGWGHRDGTTIGRQVRNMMLKWALYVMVFGFLLRADNAAHGAGFVAGAAIGWLVDARKLRQPAYRHVRAILGVVGTLAVVATTVLALVGGMTVPPR